MKLTARQLRIKEAQRLLIKAAVDEFDRWSEDGVPNNAEVWNAAIEYGAAVREKQNPLTGKNVSDWSPKVGA